MSPPLVLDIDGTLTREGGGIDPRVFEVLRRWSAPVVVATGKAFPYPIALCNYVGIDQSVIAENGGMVYAAGEVGINGDPDAARAVLSAYEELGYGSGWGEVDLVNRWRETEIAVDRGQPLEPLEDLARDRGLEVIDTGYAYHVKRPEITKGLGLETVADLLDLDIDDCVAIGDSINDVSLFERVGRSFAVANADDDARGAADTVLDESYADGTLSVLESLD